ncbi:hypothetical protein [Pseudoalteromonas ostreae]|uniref:hypothetical protein n=1 Tax=Pseudoalteromonas ostreae TaxID=2774154 RepID=UPI001B396D9C|nr:hypothetical protein [Pseudoalteromonas ostreae]
MNKAFIVLLLLTGCAGGSGIDRAEENIMVTEFYAHVKSTKRVQLSSEVKNGMIVGAGVGVIEELDGNHKDMISGTIAGALVGGLFTALFEGSDEAYEYQLSAQRQGAFSIVQKEQLPDDTQCVKVRVADKATLEKAPNQWCENNELLTRSAM